MSNFQCRSAVRARRCVYFVRLLILLVATTSTGMAAAVPQVCQEKFSENSAIPSTQSCLVLAATAPSDLSNYFCGSYAEEFCVPDGEDDGEGGDDGDDGGDGGGGNPSEEDQEIGANAGNPSDCNGDSTSVGNPINIGTGNKYQREQDIADWSPFGEPLVRHYNSQLKHPNGSHWQHSWQRRLAVNGFEYRTANGDLATQDGTLALVRADGRTLTFYRTGEYQLAATSAESPANIPAVGTNQYPLDWTGTEWRYRNDAGHLEYYNEQGQLLRITNRQGFTQTVERDDEGRVQRVIGPFNRALMFAYNSSGQLASVTDPAGQAVAYGYDNAGLLTTVTDRNNATRTYHYGENGAPEGYLTGITDENGNRFATWAYDDQNRAILSEHAGGAERVNIEYHSDNTVHVTDANGGERTYTLATVSARKYASRVDGDACGSCSTAREQEYDNRGLPTRITDRNGTVTTLSYNPAGLEVSRTEAVGTNAERTITTEWNLALRRPLTVTEAGRRISWAYDTLGRVSAITVTDTTTGANRTTTYQYHPTNNGVPGQLASIDGPRTDVQDITRFRYNTQGNRTQLTNALGHITTLTNHDAYGRPTTVTDPNGLATTLSYDPEGRIVEVTAGQRRTTLNYDAVGNLITITRPTGAELHYEYDAAQRLIAIADEAGDRLEYTLDAAGNRTEQRISDASGTIAIEHSQAFDQLGRLIRSVGAQGQTTQYQYDSNDNLTQHIDPAGQGTSRSFDALDRVIRQTDALGGNTALAYDNRDRLTQVIDPNGHTTYYTYNGFGDRTVVDSPDAGTDTYTYNTAGQIIRATDARGQTTAYTRDSLGRITQSTYGDGSSALYTWDQGENATGRLSRINETSGTTEWRYNRYGDITERTQTADSITLTTTHEYDQAGRHTAMVYPSGTRVTYRHTADKITALAVNGEPVLENIDYQPLGPVNSWTWGDGDAHARTYDRDGRLIAHSMPEDLRVLTYSVDSQITGISGPNTLEVYDYDALDRLTHSDSGNEQISFTYDANGNRLSRTKNGDAESYQYAQQSNRLESLTGTNATDYQYEAAGNLIADGQYTFGYGARARLNTVNGKATAEYRYNALGQRIYKRVTDSDGTTTDYLALAAEVVAQAEALQNEASTLRQQRDQATQNAAEAREEATTAQTAAQQAQALATEQAAIAQSNRTTAATWQSRADRATINANTYRSRITDSPRNVWQRLLNRVYRGLAEFSERIASNFQNRASTATNQADIAQAEADEARASASDAIARKTNAEATATTEENRATALQQQADETQQAAADKQAEAENYLSQSTELTNNTKERRFVYGPNNRLIGEYQANGNLKQDIIRLGTLPVATVSASGAIHYIHTDHLGTPRAATTPGGDVVWNWISSPFGDTAPNEDVDGDGNTFTLNLRFPGQYFDEETELHYNYFRDYDPGTGRYVQSDPIGLQGGLNIYAYVGDNPLKNIDPYGLWSVNLEGYLGVGGGARVAYSNGTLEVTGRLGVGLGLGLEVDPNATVSPHSEECGSGYIARTTLRANATAGVGVADLGIAFEGASGNAVVSSTLADAYGTTSPLTANFGEPSKFGLKLGASVGVDFGSYTNF